MGEVCGPGRSTLENPLPLTVVDVGFFIILTIGALHAGDTAQLIAHIPLQGLTTHQHPLITTGIKRLA